MPVPAPSSSHHQARAMTASKPARTIDRSRLRRASRFVASLSIGDKSNSAMLDHAVIVEVQVSELTVAVFQLQLDLALCGAGAASDFRDFVFKSVRDVDAGTVVGSGEGVLDRLTNGFSDAWDDEPTAARFKRPRRTRWARKWGRRLRRAWRRTRRTRSPLDPCPGPS